MTTLAALAPIHSGFPQLQYRRLNPLEIPDWSAKLAQLPGATFFHDLAWARVLQETYGYVCDYFVAERGSVLTSLVPMMEINSWLTGRRGVGLPFTDASPPLMADTGSFEELFISVRDYASERRWKFIELRGGSYFEPGKSSTSFWGHRLELYSDEAQQLGKLTKATRGVLKKADYEKVKLEVSTSLEAILEFYGLLCKTRKRHGVPPQPVNFFRKIHEHVLAEAKGFVVLARVNGVAVAGAVFFTYGDTAIYKFAASDDAFRSLGVNNIVLWKAIRLCGEKGFRVMDFGRSSLANEGLRKFKLSWGAIEHPINYIRLSVETGEYLTVADEAAGWHNHVFRAMPTRLSQLAGSFLYRHVA